MVEKSRNQFVLSVRPNHSSNYHKLCFLGVPGTRSDMECVHVSFWHNNQCLQHLCEVMKAAIKNWWNSQHSKKMIVFPFQLLQDFMDYGVWVIYNYLISKRLDAIYGAEPNNLSLWQIFGEVGLKVDLKRIKYKCVYLQFTAVTDWHGGVFLGFWEHRL